TSPTSEGLTSLLYHRIPSALTSVGPYNAGGSDVGAEFDWGHTHRRSATTMIFANLTSRRRSGMITRRQLVRAGGRWRAITLSPSRYSIAKLGTWNKYATRSTTGTLYVSVRQRGRLP